MTPLERAALSDDLLQSRMFKEAHAAIRNELIAALEAVAFDDIEKQHELTLSLQLHNRLKRKLERWVEDGKVEQKRIDAGNFVERMRERLKIGGF
jgi:hypothetical protein